MMKIYSYCDKCGKPVDNPSSTDDGIMLCKKCSLELYQKIFSNDSQIRGHQYGE